MGGEIGFRTWEKEELDQLAFSTSSVFLSMMGVRERRQKTNSASQSSSTILDHAPTHCFLGPFPLTAPSYRQNQNITTTREDDKASIMGRRGTREREAQSHREFSE